MKYSEKKFLQYIIALKTQIFNTSQFEKQNKTSLILHSKVILFPITQSCTHDTRHLMKKESVTEIKMNFIQLRAPPEAPVLGSHPISSRLRAPT